jgi:hypothetical protein
MFGGQQKEEEAGGLTGTFGTNAKSHLKNCTSVAVGRERRNANEIRLLLSSKDLSRPRLLGACHLRVKRFF